MDSLNILVQEQNILRGLLDIVYQNKSIHMGSNYNQVLSLKTSNLNTTIKIPPKKIIHLSQCFNDYHIFLNDFSYEDILFLFLSVLLEKSIIIVSKNMNKISSVIGTLLSMIKPFNWVHPTIFDLPEDCYLMINSPLPVILGVQIISKESY